MQIYCPICGRSVPSDSKVCAYCGRPIPEHDRKFAPEQPEKKEDNKIIIIIAVLLVIFIIVPIVIAATVYVYVTGITGPSTIHAENAAVTARNNNSLIQLTLAMGGERYGMGYTDYSIYIEGQNVSGLSTIGFWTVGEQINIGLSDTGGYEVDGDVLSTDDYNVTVTIMDTIVFDGTIGIT